MDVINSSAVFITWRTPADREPNGIIRGYKIYHVAVNDIGIPVEQPSVVDIPDGSRTEWTVGGLQSDTAYQFEMWAYTRRGDGERTRPQKLKTRGAGRWR